MIAKDLMKLNLNQVTHYLKYIPKGEKVLDVGSGSGIFNKLLRHKFDEIYAIDKNKNLLKNNDADKKILFDLDSKRKLPFNNNFFEFVFLSNIIEHLNNRKHFLKEIFRVLKINGYVLILTPKRFCLISIFDKWFKGSYNGWDDDHKYLYRERELIHELKKEGFTKIKSFPHGLLFYYVPCISLLKPLCMGISVLAKKVVK